MKLKDFREILATVGNVMLSQNLDADLLLFFQFQFFVKTVNFVQGRTEAVNFVNNAEFAKSDRLYSLHTAPLLAASGLVGELFPKRNSRLGSTSEIKRI